eukprot:4932470-Prymnesium_polylepis.1
MYMYGVASLRLSPPLHYEGRWTREVGSAFAIRAGYTLSCSCTSVPPVCWFRPLGASAQPLPSRTARVCAVCFSVP